MRPNIDVHHRSQPRWHASALALAVPLCAIAGCAAEVGDPASSASSSDETVAVVSEALSGGSYGQARYLGVQQPLGQNELAQSTSWVNTGGAWPSIKRTGDNTYKVTFLGLRQNQEGGNVQVSSHGFYVAGVPVGQRCKVAFWGPGNSGRDLEVNVVCHDRKGANSRSQFSVVYHRETQTGTRVGAYVWANSPLSSPYTPPLAYQWNSTGGINTITRAGTGQYTVRLPGMTVRGGNVMVTSFGSDATYCKPASWTPDASGMNVQVRCFGAVGQASDTNFSLDFQYTEVAVNGLEAFIWADSPASSDYIPPATWSFNSFSNDATHVKRIGRLTDVPGAYQWLLLYPGVSVNSTINLVTGYGTDPSFCISDGRDPNGISVGCMNWDGSSATNSVFVHRVIGR